MIVSLQIIVFTAVLLMLALVTPLFSPFYRKVKEETPVIGDGEQGNSVPPVSIVLAGHDCSDHLSKVLPKLLEQEYPADYQVIVIIDKSDSDSEDILKLYSSNQHLYYIILPDTSRYLSRKKLGLTLGMRAAKHDWVLVTDVHSMPSSPKWLFSMARHCSVSNNMVLGLALYGNDAPLYYRYEQLRTMMYYLRIAQRDIPFSTNHPVVMMRKSEFLTGNGFRGNLELARAEFELLVNKFGKKSACAVAIEPEARMEAMLPSPKRRLMNQLFAMDAFRCMHRSFRFSMAFNLDLFVMHLYNLMTLAAVVVAVVSWPSLDSIVLMAASILFWLLSQMERFFIYYPVLRYFHNVPTILALMMDWTISFHCLILRLKYAFADKKDFITHKH